MEYSFTYQCNDIDHPVHVEDRFCLSKQDTIENIARAIARDIIFEDDYYYDVVQDTFCVAVDEFSYRTNGTFNIEEIGNMFYPVFKECIDREYSDAQIAVTISDTDHTKNETIEFPLAVFLKEIIDDRGASETYDCDIGNIVEDSLNDFENRGRWHFALIGSSNNMLKDANKWPAPLVTEEDVKWETESDSYEPLIWFGNSDQPTKPWTIEREDYGDLSFWFESELYDLLSKIVEAGSRGSFEVFCVWYIYECDREGPDMDKIREKCIIELDENDTNENVKTKINKLFLDEYYYAWQTTAQK